MSKDIWHKPSETPDVFKSHPIIVVYEAGDQIEQMDSKEYSDLVGERYVNRWCYVDELIKENDRTRKALDVAKDTFNWIDETYRTGQETEAEIWGKVQLAAQEITATLENKNGNC